MLPEGIPLCSCASSSLKLLVRRYIQLLLLIRSSCNMPYSFMFFVCVITALMYYAVFFRVRLLLSAYYDSLVPDPGSRSRLQPRAHVTYYRVHATRMRTACVCVITPVLCAGVSVLLTPSSLLCNFTMHVHMDT